LALIKSISVCRWG